MIPMIDTAAQLAPLRDSIEKGLAKILESGSFVNGDEVLRFEQAAAQFLDVEHAISCASGTDALHLALRALDVGEGDEVITSPFSFFATVEAILYVGARPVFVDIEPLSLTLDAAKVEAAISPNTKAIIPVHIFGQSANMKALQAIAVRHRLALIEDCAQSFGARTQNSKGEIVFTGAVGDAGCFSFFPSKNLGACGDGGMITCKDADLAARLRKLCNHGSIGRHHHDEVGYNSRLDEMQATILRIKLQQLEQYNQRRQQLAQFYSEQLRDIEGLQVPDDSGSHVYNLYTLQSDRRDQLAEVLQEQHIACAIHYPRPLYRQPVLASSYRGLELPVVEQVCRRVLSLPLYPELSLDDAAKVVAAVRAAYLRAPASS